VVPFLTDRTNEVLGVVNLSITVNLAVNLLTLFVDGARLRAAGDMVSSAVSFAAALAIWRVFPFSYPEGSVWTAVTRVLLGIGLFGTAVAVLVSAFTLISGRRPDDRSRPAPRSSSTGAVG
jgi:hypothetical protein